MPGRAYLTTWQLCFLSIVFVTLVTTALVYQYTYYYRQRSYVTKEYTNSNTSQILNELIQLHSRTVPFDLTQPHPGPRSNSFKNDIDVYIPDTISSEMQEVNPHPYKFIINYPNVCLQHEEVDLLIAVASEVRHFDERQAVRDTWGDYARKLGAKLLFFLGDVSHKHTFLSEVPRNHTFYQVHLESQKFQDTIQENFMDSYSNLTIKTVSIMKWVMETCPHAKWVLKIQDDNLLNVDRLMEFVQTTTAKKSMYGMLAHKWLTDRNVHSKLYVSKAQYPHEIYPDFLAGPAYLFTGDSAKALYNTSLYTPSLHLEDVYITGIVAKRAGVKIFHLQGITNSCQRITPCLFNNIINSNNHSAEELRRSWYKTQSKFFICLKGWFVS